MRRLVFRLSAFASVFFFVAAVIGCDLGWTLFGLWGSVTVLALACTISPHRPTTVRDILRRHLQ